VRGTLALSQFWPDGTSDADTASVIVDVHEDSFRFRPHDGVPFAATEFYKGAKVRGRLTKPPVSDKNKLTIRLQGIDAPELHYRPAPLTTKEKSDASEAKKQAFKNVNHSYRQHLGATAAKKLHDFVRRAGSDTINCRVFTHVDKPNEVFDTYARFVGDIEITVDGRDVNINQWLVEDGWAFPGFYVSMNDDEIESLRGLAASAKRTRKGIWKYYSKRIGAFDFTLREPLQDR
jgi:endonuclease YncB( thermonuclease family)